MDPQSLQTWPWVALTGLMAALALFLNQFFPPLRLVIKRRKLRLGVADYVVLSHHLGDLRLGLHIDIHNTGGFGVVVRRIKCILIGPKREHGTELFGFRYSSGRALGEILIKYDDHWGEDAIFWTWMPDNEVARGNELMAAIRTDWNNIVELENSLNNIVTQFEDTQSRRAMLAERLQTRTNHVEEARSFFREHLNLVEGRYELVVGIISDDNKLMGVRASDFTLFRNHIDQLEAITKKYEQADFGEWNPPQISVRMHRGDDKQAGRKYGSRLID